MATARPDGLSLRRRCADCGGNMTVYEDGKVCGDCLDAMRPATCRFDEDPEMGPGVEW